MIEEINDLQANKMCLPKKAANRATYDIRIKDHLDSCWGKWFEGWSPANLGDGEVSLHQANVDQAALYSVLNKIRDLNLTLLSLIRIEETGAE